jgi:hypothetical protein
MSSDDPEEVEVGGRGLGLAGVKVGDTASISPWEGLWPVFERY